jgi:putative NADH-flavin reductase
MSTPPTSDRIGFVGASSMMGHGMAKNLVRKGFPTTLLVRPGRPSNARLGDLFAAGAAQTESAAELARGSDVVLMCVTGSAEVESVVFGGGAGELRVAEARAAEQGGQAARDACDAREEGAVAGQLGAVNATAAVGYEGLGERGLGQHGRRRGPARGAGH